MEIPEKLIPTEIKVGVQMPTTHTVQIQLPGGDAGQLHMLMTDALLIVGVFVFGWIVTTFAQRRRG